MDSTVKQLWVDALLSGEYTQGRNRLRTPDSWCCLGVLADVYVRCDCDTTVWELTDDQFNAGYYNLVSGEGVKVYDGYGLPDNVTVWAHLSEGDIETLARMNDQGYSFEEIVATITDTL